MKSNDCAQGLKQSTRAAPRSSYNENCLNVCRTSGGQSELQSGAVVLGEPLLKRALSRREKHEVLFGAAVLALGRDRALKQQPVNSLTVPMTLAFPEDIFSYICLGSGVGASAAEARCTGRDLELRCMRNAAIAD